MPTPNEFGTTQALTITVTGLAPSTSYDFLVYASNTVGNGANSNTLSALTTGAVPSQVTGVVAANTSGNSIRITWQTPAGVAATGYQVQYKTAAASTYINAPQWNESANGTTSTPNTGTITDGAGNTFFIQTNGKIAVNGIEDAVTSGVILGKEWAHQFYQENNASAWYVFNSPGNWTQVAGDPATTIAADTSFSQTIIGLTPATSYNFRVYAFNATGNGPISAVVTMATTTVSGFVTQGASILDPFGNKFTFKGTGWWGSSDNPPWNSNMFDLSWKSSVDVCKAMGFNCIRQSMFMKACLDPPSVLMRSDMTTGINSDLAGKNLMEFCDLLIDYCGTVGMYVLMDMHNITAIGNPSSGFSSDGTFTLTGGASGWSKDGYTDVDYVNAWRAVATRWAGKPAFAACDMMNEPWRNNASYLGGANQISLKDLFTRAGNAIHTAIKAVNANYSLPLIVCQLPDDGVNTEGGNFKDVGANLISLTNANKVVYAPHAYPLPWGPSGYPDSGNAAMDWWNRSWGYLATNNTAPLWITEWGGTDTGYFTNAVAYWNTLVPYMLGTSGYAGAPTKRIHWQIWDFTRWDRDVTGIMDPISPPAAAAFTTRAGARGWLQALIAAAPT